MVSHCEPILYARSKTNISALIPGQGLDIKAADEGTPPPLPHTD
jgi:hypothetical protein